MCTAIRLALVFFLNSCMLSVHLQKANKDNKKTKLPYDFKNLMSNFSFFVLQNIVFQVYIWKRGDFVWMLLMLS